MALKGKKPSKQERRLKLFMFGDAGVGKTTASCQLPSPYIIDAERGTDNYSDLINESGGSVFHTTDISEVIEEVRVLSIEKHGFKTLVIDPISPLWFDLVEKCEDEVGSEWGKHYQEAGKHMKRLVNLLMRLDMNVIITAHAKPEYGDEMKRIGTTFDGWKRLPYIFDLVLHLEKKTPTKRTARVVKTRLESFPDGEMFDFTFDELSKRYSSDEMERTAEVIKPATADQVILITNLEDLMKDGNEFVAKCMKRAKVDDMYDLSIEQADKIIETMKKEIEKKVGAV